MILIIILVHQFFPALLMQKTPLPVFMAVTSLRPVLTGVAYGFHFLYTLPALGNPRFVFTHSAAISIHLSLSTLLTAQILAAAWHDPSPAGRGTPTHGGCGCVRAYYMIGQIHSGGGLDLLILGHKLPASFHKVSMHPSHLVRVGPNPGHWPGPARAAMGRVRVTLSGSGLLPGRRPSPARATARHIRVAGLGRESDGARRRRPVCRLHPPQPARRPGCSAQSGG